MPQLASLWQCLLRAYLWHLLSHQLGAPAVALHLHFLLDQPLQCICKTMSTSATHVHLTRSCLYTLTLNMCAKALQRLCTVPTMQHLARLHLTWKLTRTPVCCLQEMVLSAQDNINITSLNITLCALQFCTLALLRKRHLTQPPPPLPSPLKRAKVSCYAQAKPSLPAHGLTSIAWQTQHMQAHAPPPSPPQLQCTHNPPAPLQPPLTAPQLHT